MHYVRVVFSRFLCCLFMDDPSLFEAYKPPPPVVTLEDNLKLSTFESFTFFSRVFSLLKSALCLWIEVHHVVDSRVKEVCSVACEFHVGHTVAQEIIFYYYGPVLIRGPLNAYWAKGASLGSDTFVRKSPCDQKYL